MIPALSCRSLTLNYVGNPRPALEAVNLNVPAGSIVGLLGPNGAGKTTLLKCALGLLKPQSGEAALFGEVWKDISSEAERRKLGRVGVLLESPGFYRKLNPVEYLRFFGQFYEVPKLDARITQLALALDLPLEKKPALALSQGNRRKLHLARSLLHRPDLLVWDEPTEYLDPEAQHAALSLLAEECQQRGASALLASHRLEQMEKVCSHVAFIAGGRIHLEGTQKDVLGGVQAVEIEWETVTNLTAYPSDAFENLGIKGFCQSLSDTERKSASQGGVRLQGEAVTKAADAVAVLCHRGYRILRVTPLQANLEQRYRQVMAQIYGAGAVVTLKPSQWGGEG